jgi:tripartite motif-containing protein 71
MIRLAARRLIGLLVVVAAACTGAPAPTVRPVSATTPATGVRPTPLPPSATVPPTVTRPSVTATAAEPTAEATAEPVATLPNPFVWSLSITGRPNPLSAPSGVAIETTGNVYVVDAGSALIQVFDSRGIFINSWGGVGAEPGQFTFGQEALGGISLDVRGNVYVADSGNARVQKFDRHGAFVAEWGGAGDGPGQFTQPTGIAYDSAHSRVYVLDSAADRLQAFDADGKFEFELGSAGSGDGQFDNALGVAVDGAGQVFVADTGNGRVQVLSSDGEYLEQWTTCGEASPMAPAAIAVLNGRGRIYVADRDHDRICAFDTHGQFQFVLGATGSEPGQFSRPASLAVAQDGNLWVADQGNNRIQKFSPT